ncbi:MAG: DUF551 domain-containing protein [Clostridia bacterium]
MAQAMSEWVSVKDKLPGRNGKGDNFAEYIVNVVDSHYPTSTYDSCDAPYSREYATSALYDYEQKIWHLQRGEMSLNALVQIEDSPLNGLFISHWMPIPEPPKEDE